MPSNATHFESAKAWTSSDYAVAVRRFSGHHHDEGLDSRNLTMMCFDTWHPSIAGIPYEEHNISTSLIWSTTLPAFRRRPDPNIPGNILLYPHPACNIQIMLVMPSPSASSSPRLRCCFWRTRIVQLRHRPRSSLPAMRASIWTVLPIYI